jgi:hypothetical protein
VKRDERGFLTLQFVVATGLSLVLLALVANLLVDLYARAAIREALDEGVHAAVPVDAEPGACEARARAVLRDLLPGPIGDDVTITCETEPVHSRARAEVTLRSWLPVLPAWTFTIEASAHREA